MLFGLKYVLQSPIHVFKSLHLHPVSSRDIGELKTDSETYRRNHMYPFTPASLLSERLTWAKGRRNQYKMN